MKNLLTPLALALSLVACRATPPAADWVEHEFTAPSESVMWEVVRRSLRRMEFPTGAGMDRTGLKAESGWKSRPSPFKDQGFRSRAVVEIDPIGRQTFQVRARVQRQTNEALVNPGDLRYAQWTWEEDDTESARILVQHMRTFLDTDLSPGDD